MAAGRDTLPAAPCAALPCAARPCAALPRLARRCLAPRSHVRRRLLDAGCQALPAPRLVFAYDGEILDREASEPNLSTAADAGKPAGVMGYRLDLAA